MTCSTSYAVIFFVSFFFISKTNPAFAADQEIYVGGGALSAPLIEGDGDGFLGDILINMLGGRLSYSPQYKSSGVFMVGYGYHLKSNLVLTVDATGESLHDHILVNDNRVNRSLLLGLRHEYASDQGAVIYSRIAAGLDKEFVSDQPVDNHTAYQIDFVGIQFGGRLYGFAKLGVGYEGIFSAGLGARF